MWLLVLPSFVILLRYQSRLPGDGKGTEKDDRVICLIINTAEYCGETVDSLSESLENTLDEEYKDYIDLTDANEAFTATISAALGSLVTNVEARMDPALQSMLKVCTRSCGVVNSKAYLSVCSFQKEGNFVLCFACWSTDELVFIRECG